MKNKNNSNIKHQTQKGRLPFLKQNFIKNDHIGIYSKIAYILTENLLKTIKFNLKLTPKISINKREGSRMGKGKSKIIGYGHKIKKGFNLLEIKKIKEDGELKKRLKNYKENKIIRKKLIKLALRLPFIKII